MRTSFLAAVTALAVAASFVPGAETARAICPIVNRGSPTDRVTTVTLVSAPAPCVGDPLWAGWQCAVLQSDANDNGISYQFEVRWNRHGLPVNGTVTWLQAAGRVFHRENTTYAAGVQDTLATVDGVRSVELRGTGEAFLTAPRNGFPNVSAVYADLLEFLIAKRVVEGVRCHYGNSAGTMIGANALAYHGVDQLLDGVVFGGGPYWANLELTCLDSSYGTASERDDIDQWNWLEFNATTPCTAFDPSPDPTYACRSTLGPDADTDYTGLRVAVIIGKQDPFLPWIDAEATDWFQRIEAESKTFDRPVGVGHTVFNFVGGATLALQRIREIIAAPAATSAAHAPAAVEGLAEPMPSPFAEATRIAFVAARAGHVSLTVHDSAGRRVATLVDGARAAGPHGSLWSGRDDRGRRVPSGVYFLRLEAEGASGTRKVVLVR
jgi:hypothetical protein